MALLIGTSPLLAAEGNAGGAAAYLKMGVGARALGMGGAFAGVADDATSTFWNPAGVARLHGRQLSTMHADLSLDRSYNFINMINPGKYCNWGISWIRAGVDSIQGYDLLGNPTTVFDDREDAVVATAAKRLKNGIDIGISFKYLKHELFNNSADGFGFDLGMLYDMSDHFRVGLVAKELGAELEWDTASNHTDEVPYKLAFGCSYKLWDNALLALDVSKVEDQDTKVFFGGETIFKEKFAVRAGLADEDFTVGAGLRLGGWEIDYAFQEQELGDIHRVSALFKFDTGTSPDGHTQSRSAAPRGFVPESKARQEKKTTASSVPQSDVLKSAEDALAQRDFEQAAELFEAALKQDPTLPEVRYKIGMAYMMAGKTDQARVVFAEALKREPDSRYARYAELLAR